MAAIAALPSLYSICKSKRSSSNLRGTPSSLSLSFLRFRKDTANPTRFPYLTSKKSSELRMIIATAKETLIPEKQQNEEAPVDQPTSGTVSLSDMLIMFFKAEGKMNESAIPRVTKALEGTEGISDLKVQIVEGIASVELTKQTTLQATGVASSLIEIIQGSAFKLQTLYLSFEDEEDFTK